MQLSHGGVRWGGEWRGDANSLISGVTAAAFGYKAAELREAGESTYTNAAAECQGHVIRIRGGVSRRGNIRGVVDGDAFSNATDHALATHHGVSDNARAVAGGQSGLFTHGAQTATVAKEGVDAFRVKNVMAWELAYDSSARDLTGAVGINCSRDEIVQADGTRRLLEGCWVEGRGAEKSRVLAGIEVLWRGGPAAVDRVKLVRICRDVAIVDRGVA